jgi:PAS domain S-box-containing protein
MMNSVSEGMKEYTGCPVADELLLAGLDDPLLIVAVDSGHMLWTNQQGAVWCGLYAAETAAVQGIPPALAAGWQHLTGLTVCGRLCCADALAVQWRGRRAVLLRGRTDTGKKEPSAENAQAGVGAPCAPRREDERYRIVYDTMAQGVVFQDRAGSIVCANAAAERLLGLGSDAMRGMDSHSGSWQAVDVDGSPLPGSAHPSMVALRTGRPVSGRVMGIRHQTTGAQRWLVVSATPLFTGGGSVPAEVFSTFEDITELAAARRELALYSERLQQVIDRSPLGVFLWQYQDGRFTFLHGNPASEAMLGITVAEYAGQELLEMLPELDPAVVPAEYANVMRTGIPWHSEQLDYADDVISGAFEVHAFRAGSEVLCVMFQDITQRKRTEAELATVTSLLQELIDVMPSVLVAVDTAGRVTRWNHAAESLTGISAAQAAGRELDGLFAWPAFVRNLLGSVQDGPECAHLEDAAWEHDGVVRHWDVTMYPLKEGGGGGYALRLDDVTSRVRLREMMIQSEKMLSVAGLAAGMAHEINNPLGAIAQAAQNCLRRMGTGLPANLHTAGELGLDLYAMQTYLDRRGIYAFMEDIRHSCSRAARIVSNMLAFSRTEKSSRSCADIHDVIRQAVVLAETDYDMKRKYDIKRVRVRYDFAENVPQVWCSVQGLQQVFLNLVRNSSQALSEQAGHAAPELLLRTSLQPEGRVEIRVCDNGPGMSEEAARRCFEPFYTTKPVGEGTGLGLYVSYLIIKQHQGTIHLNSGPQRGAEFVISLPALC